jgi:Fe-S-cluster containining protein
MNKCGDCQVCCEVLSVDGLKDAYTKCKYQTGGGCSIYKSRPKGCSHFKCGWLTSDWPEDYRPDKSGIMIAATPGEIKAFRLKDEVNKDPFKLISDMKNLKGYDIRGKI